MTRTQGDELVCACCLLPHDGVRRAALADWLRESDDPDLADAVAGPDGEVLVRHTLAASDFLKVLPSVRVLFAALMHHKCDEAREANRRKFAEILDRNAGTPVRFEAPTWFRRDDWSDGSTPKPTGGIR